MILYDISCYNNLITKSISTEYKGVEMGALNRELESGDTVISSEVELIVKHKIDLN